MLMLTGAAQYIQIHNDVCQPLLTLKRYPITSVSLSVCILFTYLYFFFNRCLWFCFSFSFLFLAFVCEFCLSIQLYCFTIFFQLLKCSFPLHFFFRLFISCVSVFFFSFQLVTTVLQSINSALLPISFTVLLFPFYIR